MQSSKNIQDVIIIGGGPAGSTAATFLVMKGYKVTVLEKEKFPRDHVGESLLPFCYNIFKQLGVLDELSRGFVRKPGVRFIDVDGVHKTTYCFDHVIKDPSYLSFHVIRAEFDQLLLDNACKHGVTVREQTSVQEVVLDDPDGLVLVHAVGVGGKRNVYKARFLIDASGQKTFLANRMGWKKPHKELDRVALSTHWTGAKYIEGIEEGLLHIIYLGGNKKGWIWTMPVGTDRLSIGVVMNNSYMKHKKRGLTSIGVKAWQFELYHQELMSSPFVSDILQDAQVAQPLMINGDYSYFVEKKYGKNFAIIGDAATFIDPIFASGVYLAMNSARLVSDALHKKFISKNGDNSFSLDKAYTQVNGAYKLMDKLIRLFYNPRSINFAQVGSAAHLIYQKHEMALSLLHHLLAGDFFERHQEYIEFIDLLQDKKLFEKYKYLVTGAVEFHGNSCGMKRSEVFPMLIEYEKALKKRSKTNGKEVEK